MSEDWRDIFDQICEGAAVIKESCLNRNEEEFAPWHAMAYNAVALYAPRKLPSFDEIRFASDYFLSKSGQEQEDINDRIALVSDIGLFLKMLAGISNELEKTRKFRKPRAAALAVAPNPPQPSEAALEEVRKRVLSLSISPRDREDVFQEIERVERELVKSDPDWDSIKRTIKFFLDFDRNLALDVVPRILALVLEKT
ncbi:MAG: hypothetical protein A3K09_06835 [Nitrospinae bacterium RIFCSPLOWO2_12_FULL_47_7]|nr:MAG: hypothetical protein A3K09_06835 [Nitrospinae bacterium RIFCSPLOWO2_12_FULL_47_7]